MPIPGQDKSVPAETLVDIARRVGIPAESRDGLEAALAAVGRLELEPPPRVLITGSLYLAGEVLARTARRRSEVGDDGAASVSQLPVRV